MGKNKRMLAKIKKLFKLEEIALKIYHEILIKMLKKFKYKELKDFYDQEMVDYEIEKSFESKENNR